jgi:aspartyl-tRNA(Asn)/glutamyl-tRNA(Gln) amidotransferase subunit A
LVQAVQGDLLDLGLWVIQAQRFRRWYHVRLLELFREVDIILTQAARCSAPWIDRQIFVVDDREVPLLSNIGIDTQPLSFVGLPIVVVPGWSEQPQPLPIGVQIVAAPWREALALREAVWLERAGVAVSRIAG